MTQSYEDIKKQYFSRDSELMLDIAAAKGCSCLVVFCRENEEDLNFTAGIIGNIDVISQTIAKKIAEGDQHSDIFKVLLMRTLEYCADDHHFRTIGGAGNDSRRN